MGSTRLEWLHTCKFNCHGQIMSCHVNVTVQTIVPKPARRRDIILKPGPAQPSSKSYQPGSRPGWVLFWTAHVVYLGIPIWLGEITHDHKWHYHNLDEIP
jgi:hypothetical protein